MFQRILNISKTNSFFLFGARGTGKSTLIKSLLGDSNTLYIDLLKYAEFNDLSVNPDSLESRINKNTNWVIIDEVQKVPAILDTVHRLIEEKKIKFALTGSSARKLRHGGANLLAGRTFVYHLHPLTVKELGDRFNLLEAIAWGSLPKVLSFTDVNDKREYLEAYALTYLQEEIWNEHLVRDLNPFRRFLGVAAQSNGKVINYANIAKDVRLDIKTVQNYFQILEDTLLGFFLEPYRPSLRERQKANPKFFLFDLGVTRALIQDFALSVSPQSIGFGQRFEHFLIAEIWRLNSYTKKYNNLSFIREDEKREVDLVLSAAGEPPILIEIKSHDNIEQSAVENLIYFGKRWPKAKLLCLSLDPIERNFENVRCLHWKEGLKILGLI